jgi:hypothetical protein
VSHPAEPAPVRHRAPVTPSQVVRQFGPPAAAVGSVAVVIVLLLALNSRPTPSGPGPGAVAQLPSARSAHVPSLPVHEPPATQHPVTEQPVTQHPVTQHPVTQHPVTQTAKHPSHPSPTATAARPPVTVLNNSRRQGLAHSVASQLQGAGWLIRQTGNFRGRIRTTTVYYLPGQSAAAAALARQFPQIHRILPRFAGLPGSGLTVVVTRDWT